jgi:aminotransferase
MKNTLAQRVQKITPSGIRRFFDIAATMKDVISLSIGEPDFVTPDKARSAGIASIMRGETKYTSNSGTVELRETIEPGDEVIVPEPSFVAYRPSIILAGGTPVVVETRVENRFQVAGEDIERAITARTKGILIGYPNNPTGAVMPREQLLDVARIAEKHDLLVFSDEIYDRLVYGVEHVCFASLPGMWERTILLGGFSKDYAMTGWRIGYACANPEILGAVRKIHQYIIMSAPTMGQACALEALLHGEADVLDMVRSYDKRRRRIVSGFNRIGLPTFEPGGAFYAFPDIRGTGLTSEEFCDKLLTQEHVAVVPGSAFGACGEGFVRACYAASMEDIEEALVRVERFLK